MTTIPTTAENQEVMRALLTALRTTDADAPHDCDVRRCVQDRVVPLLNRHIRRGRSVLSPVCLNPTCVNARKQLRDMLNLLAPSIQPGGGVVEALKHVITTAADIKAQRDRATATVMRVTALMQDHRHYGSPIDPGELARTLVG